MRRIDIERVSLWLGRAFWGVATSYLVVLIIYRDLWM